MQVPIIHGIGADSAGEFRTSYPINLIPVPKSQGISNGYLRPAEGIVQNGTGPGGDRGSINWNGTLYRVMGTKLCSVTKAGAVTALGDVGAGGNVTMDYGFDRLAIASGGRLYYWNGSTLSQVTDADLGTVVDLRWIAGYYMTTDGTSLIVTELNDPTSINPLKYGSAESDPDPIKAVDELRNEAYAFGRYTIEVFQNIGGANFPFQRVDGAQVSKGPIGTHMYCSLGNTFAFTGSGRGEAPAVYVMVPGDVQKISTREIDRILASYSEEALSQCTMECRVDLNHQTIYIHLPDQTLAFDTMGTKAVDELMWYRLSSGINSLIQYKGQGLVWCYDQWNVADHASGAIGVLSDSTGEHYGQVVGWQLDTQIMYADGNAAILHEIEMIALSGRVKAGSDPVVWTSYSTDGETWSQERQAFAGKQGQRNKRICWRSQGKVNPWRIQRFRGTSDAHLSIARLEVQVEPLFTRPGGG
jgi:hypothetical protein